MLSPDLDFEVRLGGHNNNAGLFNRASSGTNLSMSDTGVSITDLAIHPTDNDKVISTTRSAIATDFGNGIRFLSGTDFITGLYWITAVNGGYWILDRDCYLRVADVCPPTGNLVLWFKADAITGMSDGQTLPIWVNSINSVANAATFNPTNRLTYQTSLYNGLPAVRSMGVLEQGMAVTGGFTVTLGSFTLYLVVAPSGSLDGHRTFIQGNTDSGANLVDFYIQNNGATQNYQFGHDGFSESHNQATTGIQILTWVVDTVQLTGQFYKDGMSIESFSFTEPDLTTDNWYIGAALSATNGSTVPMRGDFCEILLYNTSHDPVTIEDVYTCLNEKWIGVGNVVAYYHFDLDLLDSGPNGYNLTGVGGGTFVTGIVNEALDVGDGVVYSHIVDEAAFTGATLTIEMIIHDQFPGTDGSPGPIYENPDTGEQVFLVGIPNTTEFRFSDVAGFDLSSVWTLDDSWYHVVGVFDNGDATLYVNGVETDTAVSSETTLNMTPNATNVIFIGTGSAQLDEVRILSVAWSPSEVLDRYNELVGLGL